MVELKTAEDMRRIAENGAVIRTLFDRLESWIEPGMSTLDIDRFCEDWITSRGCNPSSKGFEGFPGAVCVSVNEVVIHGIPSRRRIVREGDIVGVDVVVDRKGQHYADSTRTFKIGAVSPEKALLVKTTQECLELAIEAAGRPGARLMDISRAVYNHATGHGYGVVRDYCGHGVGYSLHEDPEVPNFVSRFDRNIRLREGLVLAIEPMINMGTFRVDVLGDGWTVVTADGKPSAHFEHTVGFTSEGVEVLT